MSEKWKGVTWAPVVNGRCTKHNEPVAPFTKLCASCHREQLAAGRGAS